MQIKLKNGKVVNLKWNWLVIERIEQVVGALGSLTQKNIKKRGEAKTLGDMAYAVVQACLDEEMTRNDLLSLINTEDFEKIGKFIEKNNVQTNDFVGKKNLNQKYKK